MLSVTMLSVACDECNICRYAKCRYAEYRNTECCGTTRPLHLMNVTQSYTTFLSLIDSHFGLTSVKIFKNCCNNYFCTEDNSIEKSLEPTFCKLDCFELTE
jgi:hypothetical protein